MCGRYVLTLDFEDVYNILMNNYNIDDMGQLKDNYQPNYNVAPGQQVLAVIKHRDQHRCGFLKWGFIPEFAKDDSFAYKMINARSESVDEKPSYKYAFAHHRCLLLSDGFFEWQKSNEGKIPQLIRLKDNGTFAMAGLYSMWRDPKGKKISTCTILTTQSNALMEPIHNRMPVILPPEAQQIWLNQSIKDPEPLKEILRPYPSNAMYHYQVSNDVNSSRNNSPQNIIAV